MMTQELNVCVLAAPLAAIDRRSLSQAWYSALHCASVKRTEGMERLRAAVPARPDKPESLQLHPACRGAKRATTRNANAAHGKNARDVDRTIGSEGERRARRSLLARHIERRFLDPRWTAQRATFSAGSKRVHVVLAVSAGRVRLVAVCSPAIRETVTRALAQARFALASRGVACS